MSTGELAERLRGSGKRLTAQRQRLLDAVEKLGHSTPDQLAQELDGVNLSTIYRNLEVLEELGLVRHTHLSDRSPTYHSTREPAHLHTVCRSCGAVGSVSPEVAVPLIAALSETFVVDVGHLALHGWCKECHEQPTA